MSKFSEGQRVRVWVLNTWRFGTVKEVLGYAEVDGVVPYLIDITGGLRVPEVYYEDELEAANG